IVVSSGVFSGFAADAVAPARDRVTAAIKDATGIAPAFVDATQETEYAARSALAAPTRDKAIMIDIGSGNARVGSYQKDGFQAISIENGTGRFQREIAKQAADSKRPFADVAMELRESLIAKPLREKLAAQDLIAGKSEATIVGGA